VLVVRFLVQLGELVVIVFKVIVEQVVVEEPVGVRVRDVLVEIVVGFVLFFVVVEEAERPLTAVVDPVETAGVVDERIDAAGDHLVDVE